MINRKLFAWWGLIIFTALNGYSAPSPDVLCGPFSNWMNAKTGYNAKGDGTTDDAAALQSALNALVNNTTSRVLYIPAGTYRITTTLNFTNSRNCAVIGEDPATTIIKWDGATDGDMFKSTGVAYCRYSRLTFDGASKANRGMSFLWNYTGQFPTDLENSDLIFKNMKIGIQAGLLCGNGCQHTLAECPFIRCQFINCTVNGILVNDWNTCDLWARFCLFQNCGTGVAITGAGEIAIYQSIFRNNNLDLNMGGSQYWCSIRNNYSSGSGRFVVGVQKMTIAGNIIDASTTANTISTSSQNSYILLMDNIIRSPVNATASVISIGSPSTSGAKLLSINNTFTVTNYNGSNTSRTTIRTIGDKVVDRNSLTLTEPVLPTTPVKFTGQVIEPTAMTSTAIQAAIISAATTYNGQKPVVHLKAGSYTMSSKVVVPANTDVRIVGDVGGIQDAGTISTRLNWTGNQNDTMFVLKSPSRAELKDFYINGGGKAFGIVIDKADQAGARVFMDQLSTNQFSMSCKGIGIYADGLDNCIVEGWHCYPAGQMGGVVSKGGPRSVAGDTTTTARVDIFGGNGGANSTTYPQWDVKNNGKLMVQDLWWETGSVRGLTLKLDNTSSGTITIQGGKHQYHTNATTGSATHIVNGFKGLCTAINLDLYDAIVAVSGSEPLQNVLCLENSFKPNGGSTTAADPGATYTLNATAGTNVMMYNEYWTQLTPAPVDVGTATDAWLLKMLRQTRTEQPSWNIVDLPAGVTDVKIWRVGLDACMDALTIKGGGTNSAIKQSAKTGQTMLHPKTSMTLTGMHTSTVPANTQRIALFDVQGKTLCNFTINNINELNKVRSFVQSLSAQNVAVMRIER